MGGSRSWSLGSLEGAQKKPVSLTMSMVLLLQNYSRQSTSGGKASEVFSLAHRHSAGFVKPDFLYRL